MKTTKKVLLFSLLPFLLVLFFRGSISRLANEESLLTIDEEYPPTVNGIWIKKLAVPIMAGNMIMKISYEDDGVSLPNKLSIYRNRTNYTDFRDDGVSPDDVSGDRVYAAYLNENITDFLQEISDLEDIVARNGGVIHFKGHTGEFIRSSMIPAFDVTGFNGGSFVPLSLYLLDATQCDEELKKENSLFITDLGVVEDESRTFNVRDKTGNPFGVWTFGHLIKNIANEGITGTSAKEFLKDWLKGWTDGRVINGDFVAPREHVFHFLIGPWLQKARETSDTLGQFYYQESLSGSGWEEEWDETPEDTLLKYAPFKLLAIVNRIDLRGSSGYSDELSNMGETRFIFTLINPLQDSLNVFGAMTAPGMPPMGIDATTDGYDPSNEFIDWQGMNVILEYGNPHTNICDLRDFARKWLDLSALELGSEEFNDSLEVITHEVIDMNVAFSKPNRSALNQIRTNEKLFYPSIAGFSPGNEPAIESWENANWQLSEFKLHKSSGYLMPVTVFNTPINEVNAQANLDFGTTGTFGTPNYDFLVGSTSQNDFSAVIDWVYKNKFKVLQGNFALPGNHTYGSYEFTNALVAEMDAEFLHYWDLYWRTASTTYYTRNNAILTGTAVNDTAKKLRQQFSLQTCQGCHGGETKTLFTQLRPVGYGQAINYWDPNPDDDVSSVDIRTPYHDGNTPAGLVGNFTPANYGRSTVNFLAGESTYNYLQFDTNTPPQPDQYLKLTNAHFPRISGFLTGRAFTGSGIGTWQDDFRDEEEDDIDAQWDISPLQLFYVFDPSDGPESPWKPDRVQGYNDLQMRKQGLCNFVNSKCTLGEGVLRIARDITQNVMPAKGH